MKLLKFMTLAILATFLYQCSEDSENRLEIVHQYNQALNAKDINTIMSLITDSIVVEGDEKLDKLTFRGQIQFAMSINAKSVIVSSEALRNGNVLTVEDQSNIFSEFACSRVPYQYNYKFEGDKICSIIADTLDNFSKSYLKCENIQFRIVAKFYEWINKTHPDIIIQMKDESTGEGLYELFAKFKNDTQYKSEYKDLWINNL